MIDPRWQRIITGVVRRERLNAKPKGELVQLAAAAISLADDFHNVSMRPCPTCDPLSDLLDREIGCTAHRANVTEAELRARRA